MTTANFEDVAKTWLRDLIKGKIKPNRLEVYYDGPGLLKLVEETGLQDNITNMDYIYNIAVRGGQGK